MAVTHTKLSVSFEDLSTIFPEEELFVAPVFGYGYHPVVLGQHLKPSPYRVVRKLGYAAAGTVWLSECVIRRGSRTSFVAVKILSTYYTKEISSGYCHEPTVLQTIRKHRDHPGYPYVLHLRRVFNTQSEIGDHMCFATDVLGSSILDLRRKQPNFVFPLPIAKRIVKQTLLALQLLHDCGYVHNDIKTNNIMSVLPSRTLVKNIQTYIKNHPPETYEPLSLPRFTPQPIITVKSQPLPDIGLLPDLSNLNIKLIDYGEAQPANTQHMDESQPSIFCPPESILGFSWSTPSDIWAVGCMAFELAGDYHLFPQDDDFNEAVHIQKITQCIGKIPSTFLVDCRCGSRYFDRDGELKKVVDWDDCSIERAVQGVSEAKNLDLSGLDEFLRACVIWDPRKRPTAAQLLAHPWLKGD
ncbi:kinase-like protein [Armillaria gallica]|uniref:Kinase-like protein n=1 Tax=Armillaria gallica TaxID=47427 RepID=A0A2H3CTR0_ARMGA|nr:kinase-like protein [Armillaria gallica]